MAAYKETPRQKMISMMYLVLTAMLALNVSVEVLQAFVNVNESVENTNETLTQRIDDAYSNFEQQYLINEDKVRPSWKKAKEVQTITKDMLDYVENLKLEAIAYCEGKTIDEIKDIPLKNLKNKDNFDKPTNFFISQENAKKLKDKINNYSDELIKYVPEGKKDMIKHALTTEGDYRDANNNKQSWENYHFYHTILAADITFLNKLIMDIQNAEFEAVNSLYIAISSDDYKFNKVNVKLIPKSKHVMLNDSYEAEVLIVAYDTLQTPTVKVLRGVDEINSGNINSTTTLTERNPEGGTLLTINANNEGINKFAGIVELFTPSGDLQQYHFSDQFIVSRPSVTVSATKMNVFYTGVNNPVSISAPGYSNAQITASITQGTISRQGNGWNVKLPGSAKGTATVSVFADTGEGKVKVGSMEYRVKPVPSPIATIANVNGGNISKERLIAAGGIIPKMPEDFDFDLNFTIESFEFVGSPKGGDLYYSKARGGRLTNEMVNFIRNSKRGDKIWLENIIAKGPDGNRSLGAISLQIQ